MVSPGIGSAAIVPTPVASASIVPDGLLNTTVKFSLDSCTASCSTGTRMVFVVSPAPKLSDPEVVV